MFILSNINFKWFMISLAFGLFIVYCTSPTPEIIIKYPTPENSDKLVFKDDVDNCYKFKTEMVDCPKDKSKIKKIPIQRSIEYFKEKNKNKV